MVPTNFQNDQIMNNRINEGSDNEVELLLSDFMNGSMNLRFAIMIKMILMEYMNKGALPRRCRPQVIPIGTTVRYILKAPYLGGLIRVRPHHGSSACQAQGSQKLWNMRI